jgi:hypothetical protein
MNTLHLGVNPDDTISTAWSNPILHHELHHSHIESLVGMCPKRFEFENVQLAVPTNVPVSEVRMNMGSAGHYVVETILNGSTQSLGGIIDDGWNKYIGSKVQDVDQARKLADEYQKNAMAATNWISENLNFRQVNSEIPFLLDNVHTLSPHMSGIASDWKFAGKLDLAQLDPDTGVVRIIDLKFREKSQYLRNKASSQSPMYSLAAMYYGYVPEFVYVEIIKGKVVEQHVTIDEGKIEWFFLKARQAIDFIESGNYPIQPSGWWCSKRYCRYYDLCRGKYETDDEAIDE